MHIKEELAWHGQGMGCLAQRRRSVAEQNCCADGWLYIWQGKDASSSERKASLSLATQLLKELQLPATTPVQLVKDVSQPHSTPPTNYDIAATFCWGEQQGLDLG